MSTSRHLYVLGTPSRGKLRRFVWRWRCFLFVCVFIGCACVQVHLCYHWLRHCSTERFLLETTGGSGYPGHHRRRWETHSHGVLIPKFKVQHTVHEGKRLHCSLPELCADTHTHTDDSTALSADSTKGKQWSINSPLMLFWTQKAAPNRGQSV